MKTLLVGILCALGTHSLTIRQDHQNRNWKPFAQPGATTPQPTCIRPWNTAQGYCCYKNNNPNLCHRPWNTAAGYCC